VRELYRHYSESNSADEEIANVRRTMLGYYRLARPHLQRRERFLDVGCDVGLLLDIAAKDGFASVHGLEPVPVACQTAIERMPHADVQAKFYEDADLPYDSFDLITLVHVLDHLAQPEHHLQRALRHLKPGGLVLAVVHNVECLLSRLLGERFPVFNYFHHYFFSKQTLAKLLRAHGFEPLRVSSTHNTYSLAFFLARNPLLPRQIRAAISHASRKLFFGQLPLSLALGNIAIVARKPLS
jgi:2-polyprenyl-3-methyl-5-hydroxy-6-metoxy-1,4-benzoquinol methylase